MAVGFVQNQRDEVRLMGGDSQVAGALSAARYSTHKQETLVMAHTHSHAEIGEGGGHADPNRPQREGRACTSNGDDVFPSLCATDGSKQFIDNQSVNSGRLLLDARLEWP